MADLRVCFVCLGNICRSPTAEAIFRSFVRDAGLDARIAVDSAGTGAWHIGEPADARAREAALRRGVAIESVARQFTGRDFATFDYVISMDASVLTTLRRLARTTDERAKIHNFRSFDPASDPADAVPDPYFGGTGGFDEVFEICEAGCRGLLEHLRGVLEQRDGAPAR